MSNAVRILGPVAVTLALALAAPAAPARPMIDAPTHNSAAIEVSRLVSSDAASSTSSTSFDWASAAVGAGGALVLVVLISAGLAVTGRARVTTTR